MGHFTTQRRYLQLELTILPASSFLNILCNAAIQISLSILEYKTVASQFVVFNKNAKLNSIMSYMNKVHFHDFGNFDIHTFDHTYVSSKRNIFMVLSTEH